MGKIIQLSDYRKPTFMALEEDDDWDWSIDDYTLDEHKQNVLFLKEYSKPFIEKGTLHAC